MSLFSSTTIFLVLFSMFGIATSTDCDSAEDNSDCTYEDDDDETEWYPIRIKLELYEAWVLKEWTFWVPKNVALFIKNIMSCYEHTNAMKSLDDMEYKVVLKTSEKGITKDEKDRKTEEKKILLYLLRRQWNVRPLTEVGPGAFKNDIENHTPGTLAKQMKKLLALKKRQEDRAKDLNEGNEN